MTGSQRRLGILGGTFDPPQLGHIAAAQAVMEALDLDTVLFVPAGNPWQKTHVSPVSDRLAMLEHALDDYPQFEISQVDIHRVGPSYSVDTLNDLAQANPNSQLFFILGDDAFAGITTWKSWQDLGKYAQIVVISRHGMAVEVPQPLRTSVNLLQVATLPISSTQCREEIAAGKPINDLVPPAVAKYIEQHHMYRRVS